MIVDWLIFVAVLGCCYLAYAGFRIEAGLVLALVIMIASKRFWDRSREKHLMDGASGDKCPDHPESVAGASSHNDSGSADGDD